MTDVEKLIESGETAFPPRSLSLSEILTTYGVVAFSIECDRTCRVIDAFSTDATIDGAVSAGEPLPSQNPTPPCKAVESRMPLKWRRTSRDGLTFDCLFRG